MRLRSVPPLVYHPLYSCPTWPAGHRFAMSKFSDMAVELAAQKLLPASAIHRPIPLEHAAFEAVHDANYYRRFITGKLSDDEARRIGFRNPLASSPELIERTVLECSGTALAAELAHEHGIACNLAGGTHHAHREFGSGFTILNDLAVAAADALRNGRADRVLVVDLDVHQGDGTASIFEDDERVFTFSMHCGKNFPFRKSRSNRDVDVPVGTGDAGYMALLRDELPPLLREFRPDLVLYDAGIDTFAGDDLGYLELSHAGLWQRDVYVVESCAAAGVPIATVIGGGYDRDLLALARRHAIVVKAAAHVWRRRRFSTSGFA